MNDNYKDLRMDSYAEDNATLNNWVDELYKKISREMFKNQEKWIFMSGELGEGRFPQFKDFESVYNEFDQAFNSSIGGLFSYLFECFIRDIRLGNVDLGEDMEYELRWSMGDEDYEEWEKKARKAIVDDYVKNLGEENTIRIFEKAWPDWSK